MVVHTAIILAGGLGTRLQHIVSDVPKPMAPVAGKPFLARQLEFLAQKGIKRVVLAVSYKRDIIESYFGSTYAGVDISYSVEDIPLGTGGGIKKAFEKTNDDTALVLNGDSIFICDIPKIVETHISKNADITLALKRMQHFERYGTVKVNTEGYVEAFIEKQPLDEGLINTGIYIINTRIFNAMASDAAFSFEKDILETNTHNWRIAGCELDGYFIDIGVPDDYTRAQTEIPLYLI